MLEGLRKLPADAAAAPLTDFRDIPDEVEAVNIAAPTVAHCEIGRALLERGINVLVEKPIAASISEAEQLVNAASENERIIHIGHTERFNPIMVSAPSLGEKSQVF